jgi:hypothetical protein
MDDEPVNSAIAGRPITSKPTLFTGPWYQPSKTDTGRAEAYELALCQILTP